MYKLMLLICGLFVWDICLCQDVTRSFKTRIDSLLKEEILNYSEIKDQLSVSEKNIEIDKILVLNDSVQIIQFSLGITGHKVRVVFYTQRNNIFLLSFGRSDYLIYFKKGYNNLTHLYKRSPVMITQETIIADAVLPECYKIYIVQNDSFSHSPRTFFQPVTSNEMKLLENNKEGVLAVNTIFLENRMKFSIRKGKIYLSNIFMRKNSRSKELIKYEYPKIDVIPVSITTRN